MQIGLWTQAPALLVGLEQALLEPGQPPCGPGPPFWPQGSMLGGAVRRRQPLMWRPAALRWPEAFAAARGRPSGLLAPWCQPRLHPPLHALHSSIFIWSALMRRTLCW